MTPTAWAYLRVSGDEQADRGLPIAGQRRALQEYADAHALPIARWFVDEARSATSTRRRDGFLELMSLAHADPAPCTHILLWAWSRFARNTDDAHFWKASLRRHGVQIVDVSGEVPDGLDAGFAYVYEAVIHWKDARKSEEIGLSARRGQQTLALLGYIPSGCRPPVGYRVAFEQAVIEGRARQVRRWEQDPDLWPRARLAWELRLQGRSYAEIHAATRLYRTLGCYSTFFRNPTYLGAVLFGDTAVPVPALITQEEYDAVNRNRLSRASGAYPRRLDSPYLLSGLLECGLCGRPLNGSHTHARTTSDGAHHAPHRYYRCISRAEGRRCGLPRVGADAIEQAVIQALIEHVLTADNLRTQAEALRARLDAERPAQLALLRQLAEQESVLRATMDNLVEAIERAPTSAALHDRLLQRERELDACQRQRAQAEAALRPPDLGPVDLAALRARLADPATARDLLRALVQRIILLTDGSLRIHYHLPVSDRSTRGPPLGVLAVDLSAQWKGAHR